MTAEVVCTFEFWAHIEVQQINLFVDHFPQGTGSLSRAKVPHTVKNTGLLITAHWMRTLRAIHTSDNEG